MDCRQAFSGASVLSGRPKLHCGSALESSGWMQPMRRTQSAQAACPLACLFAGGTLAIFAAKPIYHLFLAALKHTPLSIVTGEPHEPLVEATLVSSCSLKLPCKWRRYAVCAGDCLCQCNGD